MNTANLSSYMSASVPALKVWRIAHLLQDGIQPIHPQLNITNRCNLRCTYCSCEGVNRNIEMPFHDVQQLLISLSNHDAQAITLTGGGEPTMHPQFEQIVSDIVFLRMKVGLATNGGLLHRVSQKCLSQLTWCRVSVDNDRVIDPLLKSVELCIKENPTVDWAFSYVITDKPDMVKINRIVAFANKHNMTHVRLVNDITSLDESETMDAVAANMIVDDSKVIYQGRKQYERGAKRCLISLLKPNIGPDGNIYPCCGVQYAKNKPTRNFDSSMSMGNDIDDIIWNQKHFDGSQCVRCYYGDYNRALASIIDPIDHAEFV